jgi:hypothetical protein
MALPKAPNLTFLCCIWDEGVSLVTHLPSFSTLLMGRWRMLCSKEPWTPGLQDASILSASSVFCAPGATQVLPAPRSVASLNSASRICCGMAEHSGHRSQAAQLTGSPSRGHKRFCPELSSLLVLCSHSLPLSLVALWGFVGRHSNSLQGH